MMKMEEKVKKMETTSQLPTSDCAASIVKVIMIPVCPNGHEILKKGLGPRT